MFVSAAFPTVCAVLLVAASARAQFAPPKAVKPADAQLDAIRAGIDKLAAASAELTKKLGSGDVRNLDRLADIDVCRKSAEWILRHGEFYNDKYAAMTVAVLEKGLARAAELDKGNTPWTAPGKAHVLGYVSKVDGSVQPLALYIPAGYTNTERVRLDVVLHGRGATLNEVSFFTSHDDKAVGADLKHLILHVFGRTNNAYRWAGEADVFEAIAAVKRRFRVDDRRIVLRGFSMGGAGAWHLGLHHPGTWVSVEAGAGFSETIKYAKLTDIPEYQRKALHIYDAADWALNAFNLPVAGYGGEKDPQLAASANIVEALKTLGFEMKTEGLITAGSGLDFHHVVGAAVGHSVDPVSAKFLKAFHDQRAAKPAGGAKRIRFVTYTLKYNTCDWLTVEALQEHHKRATVDAEVKGDTLHVTAENVSVFSVDRQTASKIEIGEQEFPLVSAAGELLPNVYFRFVANKWQLMTYDESREFQKNEDARKTHGRQGPIDDAFSGPFLCVRGTGTAWNPAVQKWADARLARFEKDWDKWMRGSLRIKNDTDVTADDMEKCSVVLFGDPGSNSLIAKMLEDLPLHWSKTEVDLGGKFAAADHAPVLICPNPLDKDRYVVINSGHTFGEKEFRGTNALLFPRLGDWGVIKVDDGEVRASGYFDESWKRK